MSDASMKDSSLYQLIDALAEAETDLKNAESDCSAARSREIAAINKLNGIQKEIAARLDAMQASAPSRSAWGSARKTRYAARQPGE